MERLIQYLDDLEDLFFAAPLIAEQMRRVLGRILFILGTTALQIAGVILALRHPPLALAVATLLSVALLFRAVVVSPPNGVATS